MKHLNNLIKSEVLCLGLLLFLTSLAYLPLFSVFFQHEEWSAFGNFFAAEESGRLKTILSFFSPAVAHYTPLTRLAMYSYFEIFKLNSALYALESLISHLVIVCLVFVLTSRILRNKWLALFAASFFALNASSHQATSWLVADINTHMSTIFALLSLILLYFEKKRVWISVLLLYVSLLFKETSIGLFLSLPLFVFLFKTKKERLTASIKILTAGAVYLSFRASMMLFQRSHVDDRFVTETQSIPEILWNLFTFPAKMFSESIVPIRLLLSTAKMFAHAFPKELTGVSGTTAFDVFVEGTSLQIINWAIFLFGLAGLAHVLKKSKDINIKRSAVFGFSLFFINSLIYVLSPGRSGNVPVVDSRNLYFPLIGVAIFIVAFLLHFFKNRVKKVLIVLGCLILVHIIWLGKELQSLATVGVERKSTLTQIKQEHPDLPEKVVFYMDSDKPFYGLSEEEKIFPFQINLGYTLLVWYWPEEKFPKDFGDQTRFLFRLPEEGYKEEEGRGFGYYRDFYSLKEAVVKYNIPLDSIIAYHYNSSTKTIRDVTKQTIEKINE